jgi:hypothetical protein
MVLSEGSKLKIIKPINEDEAIEEDAVIEKFEEVDGEFVIVVRMSDHTIRRLKQGIDQFKLVE